MNRHSKGHIHCIVEHQKGIRLRLKGPSRQHSLRPFSNLFRRLKKEPHLYRKLLFLLCKDFRQDQGRCHNPVMAAGVHDAFSLRCKGKSGLLLYGKGIHLRPEHYLLFVCKGGSVLAGVLCNPSCRFYLSQSIAQFFQIITDKRRGLKFLQAQLRVSMKMAAYFDQFFLVWFKSALVLCIFRHSKS